jgi:hypothetical protein
MAIGSGAVASVALFAAPLRVTDTRSVETPLAEEPSLLDSERDATSKSASRSTYSSSDSEERYDETLIDFRCLLCEALSSEGFLRMAGILCHVSLAGNEKG